MRQALDETTGMVIVERLRVADTHWTRLKGLLGSRLGPGEGLWITPCNQVHMIGMRYAVDVAFLDEQQCVVRAIAGLAPGKISPKVRAARSVLELPAGTLASARLVEGARITIEGDASGDSTSFVDAAGAWLCNLGVTVFYVFFASAHFAAAQRTGQWVATMPIVVQEALLAGLFLIRRRSIASSSRPYDWLIGIAGTVLPLLLRPSEQVSGLSWLAQPAQLGGLLFAICGLMFLGRSVGVVAANRTIKTKGLYRLVRHPIYAAYVVTYLGYIATYPNLRNGLITALTLCLLNARAIAEERFLATHDPLYRDYLSQTRWRFVPYLY